MQHHIRAVLWQCAIRRQDVYDKSILPLSRYVKLYSFSEKSGLDEDVSCIMYAVCDVVIQRCRYYQSGFDKSIIYFINDDLHIIINYTAMASGVLHVLMLQRRVTTVPPYENEDWHEAAEYRWHCDGRLQIYFVRGVSQMRRTACTQDCSNKTVVPSIDAFVNSFLRFRVIRIRQK